MAGGGRKKREVEFEIEQLERKAPEIEGRS
jgi:hypothetical protein